MGLTIYQYPACSTCKKALAFLRKAAKRDFAAVDLVATPPSAADLRKFWQASGQPLQSFFNTSGASYRDGGFKDRLAGMSDDQKLAALAADGKLIKRPLLALTDAAGRVTAATVGFREDAWRALLAR